MYLGHTFLGLVVGVFLCRELEALAGNESSLSSAHGERLLSRKRRFLLFPPGANFIVTISGGKGALFETPRGYNLVLEMDMYHPLPDYTYHATSLRLGSEVFPPGSKDAPAKQVVGPSYTHSEHEPSAQDVKEYLSNHPDTWVPPNWGKDRADWDGLLSQKIPTTVRPITYQSWKSKLWETTGNDRLYYHTAQSVKRVRSLPPAAAKEEAQLSFWADSNHLNISHHRGWEHFHHYRDRRSLFDHLEATIPSVFGFQVRECLLRSICEARNLLPPKGRSMTVDILRVIFTYPLKSELSDEYSRMMRAVKPNCHDMFYERCPFSILQLLLFGNFEL